MVLEREQRLSGAPVGDERRLEPASLGSYVGHLYRAAYGLCGSRQDAEDLVQDTYENVLRRPRFLRRDQDLAYLLRVLRNAWISSARSPQPNTVPAGEQIDEVQAPHDPIGQILDRGAIYAALRDLREPLREAVVAVDIVGLTYRDAARALGTKEGTLMSRLHRARGQIAAELGYED